MHIAIAGNIGSGKTTLTGLLAKHFGWEPHYEDVDTNPYLNSFYEDMQRWSFNLQIYFLNSRFRQIVEIRKSGKTIVQDRTIYEDANIFAPNLHSMNLMSTRDFDNYQALFGLMSSFIQAPDLLIYLRATVPVLVSQIQKRGREYESAIRLDYLKNLNDMYEEWIENYTLGKLLIIDVDSVKFSENPQAMGVVIEKITAELHGLF
jgi:deoxyadenosine/deoxycytidine kinase